MTRPVEARDGGGGGWDEFWRHEQRAAALPGHGAGDQVLARFWGATFDTILGGRTAPRVIEIACGSGDVARRAAVALTTAGGPLVVALDTSFAAVDVLRRRDRGLAALVGDASRMPFPDGSFELAASQFGIEYAGATGFEEASRVVAAGGLLAAVVHLKDGAMYNENVRNLEAARELAAAAVLPTLGKLFRAELGASNGGASRAAVREADAALQVGLGRVAAVLGRLGASVAGGMVQRLAADVEHMRARLKFQEPARVVEWSGRMARELEAYEGRLASMLRAALDAAAMEGIVEALRSGGFSIRLRETTALGRASGEPAAWLLVAQRG